MDDVLDDDEHVVTMSEYIEGLEAQELNADLVLGGDDGKECTYPRGYMARQAVFSCLSCTPDGNAGVCTACSISCHDGHEVVELWTRRHFRCDCGNSKFGAGVCRLYSSKDVDNCENTYNQNYKGVYCTCKRPYPDPDDEEQGEMLQCCICEDWFHENHLGLGPTEQVPRDEEGEPTFDELVCQACAGRLQFLSFYEETPLPLHECLGSSSKPTEEISSTEKENVAGQELLGVLFDVAATKSEAAVPSQANINSDAVCHSSLQANIADTVVLENLKPLENGSTQVHGQYQSDITECKSTVCPPGLRPAGNICCKIEQKKLMIAKVKSEKKAEAVADDGGSEVDRVMRKHNRSLFLSKNWRAQLCKCDECLNLYSINGVGFLLDSEDTLQKYEEVATEKRKEKMEAAEGAGLAMLETLGHVGQIEFLHKLNDMTSELSSFFASFQESGKTVTSADVHEFFENLNRKRRRME